MVTNKQEALEFVYENDVKFIRLQLCDIFGTLKNISVMPGELERAFTGGIGFDAGLIRGFGSGSDLFLLPDPSTMRVLPWRPQQGRVIRFLCDIRNEKGEPFPGDARALLRRAEERASKKGYDIIFGPECEFYLFTTDDSGSPQLNPHDEAGYFDVSPNDKGENVRREICLTLEEMGLQVESSHHELGPGQHQVTFQYAAPVMAADNLLTFKQVVKSTALRNGLYASFMPKPLNNASGSGLHINISLHREGKNLLANGPEGVASSFMGGILAAIPELTLFLNPLVNSYRRIGHGFLAPQTVSWSFRNRALLARIPCLGEHARLELRSPDPACNPYLAFALLLEAGLRGIEKQTSLPAEQAPGANLPATLREALTSARESELVNAVLPEGLLEQYLAAKEAEWESYAAHVGQWDIARYLKEI